MRRAGRPLRVLVQYLGPPSPHHFQNPIFYLSSRFLFCFIWSAVSVFVTMIPTFLPVNAQNEFSVGPPRDFYFPSSSPPPKPEKKTSRCSTSQRTPECDSALYIAPPDLSSVLLYLSLPPFFSPPASTRIASSTIRVASFAAFVGLPPFFVLVPAPPLSISRC